MQLQSLYDLRQNVTMGGVADVIVAMRAPPIIGQYTTTWVLAKGKQEICYLMLTIWSVDLD